MLTPQMTATDRVYAKSDDEYSTIGHFLQEDERKRNSLKNKADSTVVGGREYESSDVEPNTVTSHK